MTASSAGGPPVPPAELTADAAALLHFAAHHANAHDDDLAEAVRQAFGLTLTRYRQRLARAVQTPGAEAVEPATVYRLRRLLDRRRRLTTRGARP